MRILLLLIASLFLTGCLDSYFYNRSRDFVEPFTLNLSVGPAGNVGFKATDALLVLLGGGKQTEVGLYQGHLGWQEVEAFGVPLSWAYPNSAGSLFIEKRNFSWEKDPRIEFEHYCDFTHILPYHQDNPRAQVSRILDVEANIHLFVGTRVGFSPIEFLDFFLGILGLDICDDDIHLKDPEDAEPHR